MEITELDLLQQIADNTNRIANLLERLNSISNDLYDLLEFFKTHELSFYMARVALFLVIFYIIRRIVKGV